MLRPIAFTASVVLSIAALSGLLSTLPADAQTFRGSVATATLSMNCLPDRPASQPGNIIILATGRQVV
ncbi:MAG TPA: hypothetical protein VGO52_00965, partial [Hyphomonadaceae bacterium]|nr:hypothetical protein [Hyphomonadaceae bacterium]